MEIPAGPQHHERKAGYSAGRHSSPTRWSRTSWLLATQKTNNLTGRICYLVFFIYSTASDLVLVFLFMALNNPSSVNQIRVAVSIESTNGNFIFHPAISSLTTWFCSGQNISQIDFS